MAECARPPRGGGRVEYAALKAALIYTTAASPDRQAMQQLMLRTAVSSL